MVGTLSGALEARKIPTSPDKVSADVQGTIEAPEGVLKITRISCHYYIKVPAGKTDAAERALAVFERGCPVAQTLKGCIEFEHTWEIEELK
ncbi:OsmC family protein [Mesobacillus persicus]|uniref:OsmC family protein n=1 Tax=Mesobacillus persicus TaxID=930146 RepID=UPI000B87ECA9